MGTVELKKGSAVAFFGVFLAFVALVILTNVFPTSTKEGFHFIPTVTFASDLLKFGENIGAYWNFFFGNTFGQIVSIVTLVVYILGTIFVQSPDEDRVTHQDVESDISALMRGLLIGLGSYLNLVLAENIYGTWFGSATQHSVVGLIIGIVLFALGMLASIKAISQSSVYQGIIGWLDWFTPMSWPVELLGLALGLINLFFGLIGLLGVDWLKVTGDDDPSVDGSVQKHHFSMDWATGTFFMIGGLVSNINLMKTAFNMGNIGFIYYQANKDFREHEAGHNLSLFVFGWIFHLFGWMDEMIHSEALAERLAASHGNPSNNPTLEMWTT